MDYKKLLFELLEKHDNNDLFELIYRFSKRLLG